jgi:hypothetical protein
MRNRNSNRQSFVNNADMYVGFYASKEECLAADPDGLLTVQSFDSGDFPATKSLDTADWSDGDIVEQVVYMRIHRRKGEKPVQARKWSKHQTVEEVAEAKSAASEDIPF